MPILRNILIVNIPFPDSTEISKNIPLIFKDSKMSEYFWIEQKYLYKNQNLNVAEYESLI